MPKKPNFLIILADDLGYSDVGCYGSEIKTPVIDRLASEGLRFTNFHTASACSPTRSMLMSGTDHHIAGIGAMIEHMQDEYAQKTWGGKPGHEGYLLRSVAALPEILQDAGYHTMMSGKWHLGRDPDKIPAAWGFDKSYAFLHGCHNHYAWEPQFRQNNKEDEFLKDFVAGMYDKYHMYTKDEDYITPEPGFPKHPGGFYSTETFTDKLVEYLDERKSSSELQDKPFFAYFTFTAPHWPLQAPTEERDKYRGRYDNGWGALKHARLQRQVELGLLEPGVTPRQFDNPFGITEWDDLDAEEKAKSSRAMETYAAMVDIIDQNIGRVIKKLEDDGELDNTFVLFMSDNGAEGASYEAFPFFGPQFMKVVNRYYNNDIENIGEPDSFVWYGNFWAQAATAPSRLYKMYTSQGGIRVPFIIRYPQLNSLANARPGAIVDPFCTVMDLLPTILDLAKVKPPSSNFKGREIVPIRGKSWVDWLSGKEDIIHDKGIPTGWELHGRAAMRIGDWKILFLQPPQGKGDWELFNLKVDPGETNDLSKEEPERLKQLKDAWDKYVAESGVVWANPQMAGEVVEGDDTADPKSWMAAGKRGYL